MNIIETENCIGSSFCYDYLLKYSHIFFDWYGVLSKSKFWSHIPESKIIEDALFGNLHPLLKHWLEGKCNVDGFVTKLSSETGLEYEYLMRTLKESCESLKFVSPLIPELISTLRNVGIICVISTDNFDVFDTWTVPSLHLDVMFDEILNSYNLKHVKPELNDNGYSPFFSSYLTNHNVTKALILDDQDYSHIAKALDFDFVLVKSEDDIVELVEKLATN